MSKSETNPFAKARRNRRAPRHHPQVVHPLLGVEVDEGAVDILSAIIVAGGVSYFSCSGNVGVHGDCDSRSDGSCDCWGYAMFSGRDYSFEDFEFFYAAVEDAMEASGVEFQIVGWLHNVLNDEGDIEKVPCVRLSWFPEDESKVEDLIAALISVSHTRKMV